jgi:N-acetylneuraminate synthase/N,N'-diacetyllegionaminate synthase
MDAPVFVIAEAGVNHNGDVGLALGLCDAALAAGADAVKFQTFRASDLVLPGAPTAQYQEAQTGAQDQYAMLERLELSEAQHVQIKAHCDAIGIEFFSTPFSAAAVDMLVRLGVRRLKLSSGELTHRALVEHAAATQLPLLMSTLRWRKYAKPCSGPAPHAMGCRASRCCIAHRPTPLPTRR